MRKLICVLTLAGVLSGTSLFAQSLPTVEPPATPPGSPVLTELFIGNKYMNALMLVSKRFSPQSRFAFFNVTNVNGTYDNQVQKLDFISQSLLTFDLVGGLSVAGGLSANVFTGLRPTVGFRYFFADRQWVIVLLPRVDLRDDYNAEGFGLVEYKPALTRTINLYTRLQGLYNQNMKQELHDRSYVYGRAGVAWKNYAVGLGVNYDRYGPLKTDQTSFGPFLLANFFN